jgi:hypothetical protein
MAGYDREHWLRARGAMAAPWMIWGAYLLIAAQFTLRGPAFSSVLGRFPAPIVLPTGNQ